MIAPCVLQGSCLGHATTRQSGHKVVFASCGTAGGSVMALHENCCCPKPPCSDRRKVCDTKDAPAQNLIQLLSWVEGECKAGDGLANTLPLFFVA